MFEITGKEEKDKRDKITDLEGNRLRSAFRREIPEKQPPTEAEILGDILDVAGKQHKQLLNKMIELIGHVAGLEPTITVDAPQNIKIDTVKEWVFDVVERDFNNRVKRIRARAIK